MLRWILLEMEILLGGLSDCEEFVGTTSVYDTYATSKKGIKIHFDVMLPIGGNEGNASSYAQDFIKRIDESTDSIKLDSCKFCHTEEAKTNVSEKVEKDGYCIVPIENCPNPY